MDLNLSGYLLILVLAIVLLWTGADWFVDAATRVARKWNVSELVIGLTLVGFGTSAPEFAVSIGAAVAGKADIAIANVVGSNNFNLGFVMGAAEWMSGSDELLALRARATNVVRSYSA